MGVYTDKKTGRLFVQFDHQGETYKFRLPDGTTRKQAEKLETKKKSELFFESHGISERSETLYEDFLQDVYLPHVEANHSPMSFFKAVDICRASLEFFKGRTLRSIKPVDIERFKTARAKLPTIHKRARKPATVARELSVISRVFSMAVKNDLCDYNPCSRVEKPKFDNVQDKVLRMEDVEVLFANMHSDWARDVCLFVLNTGLRQNDALKLTRFEIDLGEGLIRLVQGKTTRRVVIPLNDTAREIVERRMQSETGELIFASPTTGRLAGRGSITQALIRACDRCGIKPHLSIRDLRRTFGTRLHESAFDDTTVAQLLGHSDLRSIHRYKRGSRIKRTAVDSLVENSASPAKILPAEQMKKASNA